MGRRALCVRVAFGRIETDNRVARPKSVLDRVRRHEAVELAVPEQQIDERARICIAQEDVEQTNQLNPRPARSRRLVDEAVTEQCPAVLIGDRVRRDEALRVVRIGDDPDDFACAVPLDGCPGDDPRAPRLSAVDGREQCSPTGFGRTRAANPLTSPIVVEPCLTAPTQPESCIMTERNSESSPVREPSTMDEGVTFGQVDLEDGQMFQAIVGAWA